MYSVTQGTDPGTAGINVCMHSKKAMGLIGMSAPICLINRALEPPRQASAGRILPHMLQ